MERWGLSRRCSTEEHGSVGGEGGPDHGPDGVLGEGWRQLAKDLSRHLHSPANIIYIYKLRSNKRIKYCAYPLSTMGAIGANASAGTARPDLSKAVEFGEMGCSVGCSVVVVDVPVRRRPRRVSTVEGIPLVFLVFFPVLTVVEEEEPPLPPPGGGFRPRCLSAASSPADIIYITEADSVYSKSTGCHYSTPSEMKN